jgi:hypothetical protein
VAAWLAAVMSGCGSPRASAPVSAVDFIKEFDGAEKRPAASAAIADHAAAGTSHPAIVAPVPSRLTWVLPIPHAAAFRAVVTSAGATPIRVRVGVSDSRIYEELAAATIPAGSGWVTITADLSAYAGRKFSLFYRPDGQSWRVNLAADAVDGIPGRVAWGEPEIVTSSASALEYAKRRVRVTRSGAP